MKCKLKEYSCNISKNLLTRQRAVLKGKRRGDSQRVIATRFTCQRALCNGGKRQGDSQRVIATRFTCQRALCNRGKRQGDSQRVIDTDLVHGSSTTVQNHVQLREEQSKIYEKLLFLIENYENLTGSVKTLHVKQLRLCKTLLDIYNAEGDLGLGDISKVNVNETSNFITTRDNRLEKPTNYIPLPDSHNIYVIIKTNPYQCFQSK